MFDMNAYRGALGSFATGITVVTVTGLDGRPQGMTVNSFGSLSLDPPLILWCIDRTAALFDVFQQCEDFSVSVLAADQMEISNRLAVPHHHDLDGIALKRDQILAPFIDGCAAHFQCRVAGRHDGGDHVIMVGGVVGFDSNPDVEPLVYLRGDYRSLAP